MAAPPSIQIAFNDYYGPAHQSPTGTANTYSPADIAGDIAPRGHFIFDSLTGISTVQTMKAAQPNLFAGVYVIGHAQDPDTGSLFGMQLIRNQAMWDALQDHPEAFLYSSQSRSVGSRVRWNMSGGRLLYKLDPAALYTKQLIRNHWIYVLDTYPYIDFTFQDNIGELRNIDGNCYPGSASVTWAGKPSGDVPYTNAGWIENEHTLLTYVKAGVEASIGRTHVQWGNMLWEPDEVPGGYTTFQNSLAGIMVEAFVGYTNSGFFASAGLVDDHITAVKEWIALPGKAALLNHQVPANPTAAQIRYGWAAMLQCLPLSSARTVVQAGKTINKVSLQASTSGAYDRWYMRSFDDAYLPYGVISNPSSRSASGIWTIDLGGYRVRCNRNNSTVDGMAARSGAITQIVAPPPPPPPPDPEPEPEPNTPTPSSGSAALVRSATAGAVGDGTGLTSWIVPPTATAGQEAIALVWYRNVPEPAAVISVDDAFSIIEDESTVPILAAIDKAGNGGLMAFRRRLAEADIGQTFSWDAQAAVDVRSAGIVIDAFHPTATYRVVATDTDTTTDTIELPAASSGAQGDVLILRAWGLSTANNQPDQPPPAPLTALLDLPGSATIGINGAVYSERRTAAGAIDAVPIALAPAMALAARYFGLSTLR